MMWKPAVAVAALSLSLSACALSSTPTEGTEVLTVATHDSWAMDKAVIAEFEKSEDVTVRLRPSGDAGELTNKIILTKDAPIADVVYGIDNTFASRALGNGVLAKYAGPTQAPALGGRLVPIDLGDVCINVDDTWFAKHKIAPPANLQQLTKPRYRDLLVVPGATTSSTGLAFLLATVAKYGDAWPDYWRALVGNGVKVDAGWEDAYTVDFTGGGGNGTRPIVVSYASSPPFTIPEGGEKPTTRALLNTCFRQVEYAAVLANAKNPTKAAAFVAFMQEVRFQEALPESMYVFPVNPNATLPAQWAKWAPLPKKALILDPRTISANRESWLATWRDIVTS